MITPLRYKSSKILLGLVLLLLVFVLVKPGSASAAKAYQRVGEWGGPGLTDGLLNYPGGMAINSDGRLVVADTQNNRVQIFNPDGSFYDKWEADFVGTAEPADVAIGASGDVYVTDTYWSKVMKFTSDGSKITEWTGITGVPGSALWRPVGIALDAAENVYVVDQFNDRIQKFSSTGTPISKWGTSGGGDGAGPSEFEKPAGIAIDKNNGFVYVSDMVDDSVQKFGLDGSFLDKWGGFAGSGDGQFHSPWGIEVDPGGYVFVVDRDNSRVQKFYQSGVFHSKWGVTGTITSPSLYIRPRGIVMDAVGDIFISDSINHYVKKFSYLPVVTKPTVQKFLINGGAASTNIGAVSLTIQAKDVLGNPPKFMRFSNDGVIWFPWRTYKSVDGWILNGNKGTNTVYAQFRDDYGLDSVPVSDSINLTEDLGGGAGVQEKLETRVATPRFPTRYHNRTDFKVHWAAHGTVPASGVASYDVRYKINRKGSWRMLLSKTTKKAVKFKGKRGKTYRFQARGRSGDGKVWGWSKVKRTLIAYDNGQYVKSRRRFNINIKKKTGTKYYLNTVRRSTRRGDYVTYRFKGKAFYVVGTMGRYYNYMDVYINGKFEERVNAYSHKTRYRKVIFGKSWPKMATRTIKLVNVGNKKKSDLDGVYVLR